MNENIQELGFFDVIEARRSVEIFDQESPFDHQIVQKCLEAATLAPNSSNLQLWEFYRIPESSALKKPLDQLCMKQKAASTARELVVVVTRRDKWKSRTKANQVYDRINRNLRDKKSALDNGIKNSINISDLKQKIEKVEEFKM
ncbi:nitroreductase family protein [Aquiflexum sp.]|uniref:nitroreductase family protein n=1 Tax=Aquiflexum sp. TaxID=1872584 RepID=UPI003592EECC